MPLVIDLQSADDSRDVVHRAVQCLAEGKVVAFPTETVYAIASSALDEHAVAKLLHAKRREPGAPPLTLAVRSADEALDYVPGLSPLGRRMARRCWPGPVTLVCPDNHADSLLRRLPAAVQKAVVSQGTVGLRAPGHPVLLDTLRMLAGPVTISSAYRVGEPDALTAADVVRSLGEDVDLVIDDGRSRFGQPSSVVQVSDHSIKLLRVGVVSEHTLRRLSSLMVLFVCTGNTCRSPMAEAIFRSMVAAKLGCRPDELEDHGVMVMSAGLSAMMGGRPSPEAVQILSDWEIDLSAHESQPLTQQLVRQADHVWTMTRGHRQAILSQWPEAADRVELLMRDRTDVSDPIGCPLEVYRNCAELLKAELAARLETLDLGDAGKA